MSWGLVNAAAFVVALSGCASPDPTYYTLQVVPGATLGGRAESVEVRRPGLAGYLDRADIVLKNQSYTLSVNSQRQWGEPLGDMIGRVVTQDLSQRLPGKTVFGQSGAITADADLRVEVDILNFDADAAGNVVLDAQIAVEQGGTHHPLVTRHFSQSATPNGTGAAAEVAAMSSLLGLLSDRIASDIAGNS